MPATPPAVAAADSRMRPPGIETSAMQAPKRKRADDVEVQMLAQREDPHAAWQRAQSGAQPPGDAMSLQELTNEIRKLHFIRQQEAEHLTTMWNTGNHNANLLEVIKGEIIGVRSTVESLTVDVPRAMHLIETNDVWMKNECKGMGARLSGAYDDTEAKLKSVDAAMEELKKNMAYIRTAVETVGARASPHGPA